MLRFWLVLVVPVAIPSFVSAQEASPSAEYDRAIDEAVAEFGAGRWAEARALFERAHTLFPNARALRGLGMAAFELGDYVGATRALEAALAETARALTASQRAQVEELLLRCRAFLASYRVPPCPPGAVLRVDGHVTALDSWPTSEATLVLPLGRHELEVRMPDGRSARARLDVVGSESGSVDIDVASLSPPEEPEPLTEVVIAATELGTPVREATRGSDATPWVVGSVGLGVGVLGAVLLGIGVADVAAVQDARPGTEWSALEDANTRAPILSGVGIAGLTVGLGTAAIALVVGLLELDRPTASEGPRLVLSPLPEVIF